MTVEFDPAIYSVNEGEQVSVSVILNFIADRDVTVNLATSDGSATGTTLFILTSLLQSNSSPDFITAGSDYTAVSTVVTILAGETEATIVVATIDDNIAEQLESFSALLSGPSEGLSLGTQTDATISIVDNDGVY